MGKEPLRIYVDTSVFGGVFDREFAKASKAFFNLADKGYFSPVTSVPVQNEMTDAPPKVRELFARIQPRIETVPVRDEEDEKEI